eukprot:2217139-Rhodomonas_salina.1
MRDGMRESDLQRKRRGERRPVGHEGVRNGLNARDVQPEPSLLLPFLLLPLSLSLPSSSCELCAPHGGRKR